MKALKIIAVVLGALLVLTGAGLLVGSSFAGVGQQAFDSELTRQGFGGPVKGTVTRASSQSYVVEFTDKDGDARTGRGPVADGTSAPSVGDEVTVLYLLEDPDRIVIIDLGPAADISGIGDALRIGGIVCLVVGALLLAAGIIGLVMGRRRSTTAGLQTGAPPAGYPPAAQAGPPPGYQQGPPADYPPAPPANYPPTPPANYPPGPPAGDPPGAPETGPPGPRPDYLSGPPGPPSSGGPPGQPPR